MMETRNGSELSKFTTIELGTHFEYKAEVGMGAFGKVSAYHYQNTLEAHEPTLHQVLEKMGQVAIKQLQRNGSEEDIYNFLHEGVVSTQLLDAQLKASQHPREALIIGGFVTMIGGTVSIISPLFVDAKNMSKQYEELQGTSSAKFLKDTAERLNQIYLAMSQLHERGFVHGDLTLQNCLSIADNKVKVIDFGFSHYLGGRSSIRENKAKIPARHSNVERILQRKLSQLSDRFAFRVLLYEIIASLAGNKANMKLYVGSKQRYIKSSDYKDWLKESNMTNDQLLHTFYNNALLYLSTPPSSQAKANALHFLRTFGDFLVPQPSIGKSINEITLDRDLELWERCYTNYVNSTFLQQEATVGETPESETTPQETGDGYAEASDSYATAEDTENQDQADTIRINASTPVMGGVVNSSPSQGGFFSQSGQQQPPNHSMDDALLKPGPTKSST